jgi:glutamyl-Q tRNA(Asp) synthetase
MTSAAGRFAPSPTGPLHLGSLLAATASYLEARHRGELWLVRIDDLDVPRNVPGAEDAILRSLEAHGLNWDGTVIRQSERIERYEAALAQLIRTGHTFNCTCARKKLKGLNRYPGTCRDAAHPADDAAVRVRVDDRPITFEDGVVGPISEVLTESVGDFIIRRRDGLIAYQLATAVDDGEPGITRVIRGGDLLDNTARQIYLIQLLALSPPEYAHVPMVLNAAGQKLSKQTHASALDDSNATGNLLEILPMLGLTAPETFSAPDELLQWAAAAFALETLQDGPSSYRH